MRHGRFVYVCRIEGANDADDEGGYGVGRSKEHMGCGLWKRGNP